MRIEHQFSIAGFEVSVSFPDGWDADTLLPSFRGCVKMHTLFFYDKAPTFPSRGFVIT